jgi:hypothetical protein
MMRTYFQLSIALCLLPVAAIAQTVVVSNGGPSPVAPPAPIVATLPPIDDATTAAAQKVVDHVFPAGTMQKMMGEQFYKMMQPMMDQLGTVQLAEFGKIASNIADKPAEAAKMRAQFAKMDKATLGQLMDIIDPYWKQRQAEMLQAMRKPMADMMAKMEPDMREGYTLFYARHFTVAQLTELDRFFSTPTGSAYAAQSMLVGTDPEVMKKLMASLPKIMGSVPDMIKDLAQAQKDSSLPKVDYNHLSPEQITKMSKLLGISEAELQSKPRRHASH